MTRDDLLNSNEAVLKALVQQAEKRLEAQNAFANSQDQRCAAVIGAAVAMAAGAAALAAGALSKDNHNLPLAVGAAIGAVGFTVAAAVAMWANRSRGFHSTGYFPHDFAQDLDPGKTEKDLLTDFALDLQIRLSFNKGVLSARGTAANWATGMLLAAPIAALIAAFLAAGQ
jgi:hypothetical protein